MEYLYRQDDKYSMLEDNIRTATQTVMIINQPTEGNNLYGKKSSESKEGHVIDRFCIDRIRLFLFCHEIPNNSAAHKFCHFFGTETSAAASPLFKTL